MKQGDTMADKKEIFPGLTVEEIKAIYFNGEALREPDYRIYQLNEDGHRYYYRFVDGEVEHYPSVTTMLRQVMPTSPALINWMLDNGREGAIEKRDIAAAYGTFMHAQFERLIITRGYDFDAVPGVVSEWLQRENLPDKLFFEWVRTIRKDVLSFAQFIRDYNVKPLAVEIGLVHPDSRYAGCVDLACLMTSKGEEFPALVDFKSGRKGFYEDHEIQLALYRSMWNVNFPELPIERIFNFAPKDWRKAPSYTLKEQTGSVNIAKVPHLLALAAIEDGKRENLFTVIQGRISLDEGDFTDNVLTLSLPELIKRKTTEPTPEGDDTPLFTDGAN